MFFLVSEFALSNVSEELVDLFLLNCMEQSQMCICPRCQVDVKAYALNHFPQHYVVTHFGDAMARASMLSQQFQVDIITAITKGIVIVKDNPRH